MLTRKLPKNKIIFFNCDNCEYSTYAHNEWIKKRKFCPVCWEQENISIIKRVLSDEKTNGRKKK